MIRNFIFVLQRYKLASALNILGLGIAFAAFIVIMMQVSYELGYGKSDPNYKEMFRVEVPSVFEKGQWNCQVDGNSIKYLTQNDPRVKKYHYGDGIIDVGIYLGDDSLNLVKTKVYDNFTNPTDFFQFDIVEGSAAGIERHDQVIIPMSLSKRLFGEKSALGEVLNIKGQYYHHHRQQTIIGVYRDFAANSVLRNYIFGRCAARPDIADEFLDASVMYIRASVQDTSEIIDKLYEFDVANDKYGFGKSRSRLTPIGDIYYANDVTLHGDTPPGNRSTTSLLFMISLLIIAIASINFVNFSTAMAPLRIHGLNIRLILGRTKASLRRMLIVEAVGVSLLSYLMALFLVYCFDFTPVAELIRADSTSIADHIMVVVAAGVLSVVVGLLAGLYPAFYITRFTEAFVTKGSAMGSKNGQWLRALLIGFQYVISIALIIVAIFIALQNSYMSSFPLGFNKENVFILHMGSCSGNDRKLLTEKLKKNPEIKDVTFSWGVLGEGYGIMNRVKFGDTKVDIGSLPVQYDFLKFFSIPIVEGRDFVEGDIVDNHPDIRGFYFDSDPVVSKAIFNRRAQQMYNIKVDSIYDNMMCIGIADNINVRSLYNDYEPMSFMISNFLGNVYIKYSGANTKQLYKYINECYNELMLDSEFDCELFDSVLQQQYINEKNLSLLINLFTGLAIALSLIGVFGLVVFENQYRRREIGLRKIYGSTVMQILQMFNQKFLIITGICFVVAVPIAWWSVHEWLTIFAFRTPIYWWVFIVSLLIVTIITVTTVTIQSWRSATENPIQSMKYK
ncbi:MAG: FtsX-like permease family protein [Rikenellaceae bacterium]